MIAAEQPPFHRTIGQALGSVRVAAAGPVIVVALVLALLITLRLETYHGNAAGFALFGQRYVQYTHPPAGSPIESPVGYDGQFYWIHATDPLLLHRSTVTDIHGAGRGYRLQRPAYPALAFLLAAGQRNALPWALLAVNVLAVLGITAAFAGLRPRSRMVSLVGAGHWLATGLGSCRHCETSPTHSRSRRCWEDCWLDTPVDGGGPAACWRSPRFHASR